MNKLEAIGRLIQLVVELSDFDVRYRPGEAIKVQALANFITEFTPAYNQQGTKTKGKKSGSSMWMVRPPTMQEESE